MKSLSMLVGSLLVVGIMSGAEAARGPVRGALPDDQIKQLEEQMQKPDPAKDQTTDGGAKIK